MGKKLDALLGNKFKATKFKKIVNHAVSRIAFLEKQHRVRYSQARSDVLQLLNFGQQDRALLRVEHVIREQNMLDAYAMIENYCHLLAERVDVIQNNKKCPEELKEAISSLVFAASRCGEFPEMQKFREMFTKRFGKEFATRIIELRDNCGVTPKFVKKLSTRQPSLESKWKVLKEISPINEITLKYSGEGSMINEEKNPGSANVNDPKSQDLEDLSVGLKEVKKLYEKIVSKKKYSNVESAAQAALQLAAEAAAAAKVALEMSRPNPNEDPFDQSRLSQQRYESNFDGSPSSNPRGDKMKDSYYTRYVQEPEENNKRAELEKMLFALNNLSVKTMTSDISRPNNELGIERGIVIDNDDDDTKEKQDNKPLFKHLDFNLDKLDLAANEYPKMSHYNAVAGI
ncbi:Ist1 domain-containing protein [Cephalotus follicularis]|uniref:Ist1 domain-containing protein n=1 Tax=Cephalotus follicularis TaxID=3775 RepID=A0A1Q3C613_CEPFO|nr:Ist1 domain-containing protein [Cephalotus follicularis]